MIVTKPQWRMLANQRTQMKFSDFFQKKSGMVEQTYEKIMKWKQRGSSVKIVRCENAGENNSSEARSDSVDWNINVNFDYTARDTPQ